MPDLAISIVLLAELLLLAASWYRLQAQDIGVADALCRSLALTLAGLGFTILTLLLLHLANRHWILDALIVGFAVLSWRLGKRTFGKDMLLALRVLRRKPLFWFVLALTGALFVQVLAAAPDNYDSMIYNLSRVLLMREQNTLALQNYSNFRQLTFSLGFDLLHFFFLRFPVDYAIAVFSLMAWAITILAGYTLAKASVDRAFGLRVAVVIACLKLPLMQAVSTKNDLGAAAMAVCCILAAHSLLLRKKPGDLLFLLICLAFGLSVKTYFALFAVPFLLAFVILHRTALKDLISRFIRETPKFLAFGVVLFLLLVPIGMSSQIISMARFGNPLGPMNAMPHIPNDTSARAALSSVPGNQNQDGAAGTLANAVRYTLQIPDLPGQWWRNVITAVHDRLFGEYGPGAVYPFAYHVRNTQLHEDYSWFGLIGGLLLFPAVLAGLWAADRLTRSVALGLCGYFLLTSATVAWMPWNGRFFTLFFAASSVCLISWRNVWHEHVWPRRIILLVSMASVFPPLIVPGKFAQVPALVTKGDASRIHTYDKFFPGTLDYLAKAGSPGQKALLLAGRYAPIYPILRYTKYHWTIGGNDTLIEIRLDGRSYNPLDCKDFVQAGSQFDLVVVQGIGPIRILGCRPPWKLIMWTHTAYEDMFIYDPHTPAEAGPPQ